MTSAHPLAIRAESLVKYYPTDWQGRRRRALAGVSLRVPSGTICGLIGANGSGKSTTLKILAGLLRPDGGSCEIDGRPVAMATVEGRIGYLPEALELPGEMRGGEFLRELAELSRLPAPEAVVTEALAMVGLASEANRRIREYSKGMRQRIGLAQAILGGPAVVLLDEPASGLDPRALAQLRDLLRELRRRGRTVLLSAHELPQAEAWCDQVVLLERGHVAFAGGMADVRVGGGLEQIYLQRTAP